MNKNFVAADLIFGCGRIKGGSGEKHYRALLDKAFELGIRRFDVAPSYGLGMAEDILGTAISIAGLSDAVSVSTKFGIPRPVSPRLMTKVRSAVKPIASLIPGARDFLLKKLSNGNSYATLPLSADNCRRSVEDSLRRLTVTKFEAVLLHEVGLDRINQELIAELECMSSSGLFKLFGVSTGGTWHDLIDVGSVRQCSVINIKDRPINCNELINIHGAIKTGHEYVKRRVENIPGFNCLNELIGQDWAGGASLALAKDMSKANGIIFSTNSIARLEVLIAAYEYFNINSFVVEGIDLRSVCSGIFA